MNTSPTVADSQPDKEANPLALLVELGEVFHSTLEPDRLPATVLEHLQRIIGSEAGSIWLIDHIRAEMRCIHAVGPKAESTCGRILPAQPLIDYYHEHGSRPIRVDHPADQAPWGTTYAELLHGIARHIMLAPLTARAELLGGICLINKISQAAFSTADAELLLALAGQAAIAIKNAQLYERQRQNVERQQLLERISRYLQQTLDLNVLIPRIFEEVNKAIYAEGQSIWLLDAEAGLITCCFATGPEADKICKVSVPVGQGIVGSCVANQEAIIIADAQQDKRFYPNADAKTGLVTRSIMSVPLVREGKSIGAIQAINKRNGTLFTADDLDLLRSIADSAALAIENARLYAELAASYDSTLEALAAALDLRDRETEGHSWRVVEYTTHLARKLNLPASEIAIIRRGALIHDIGKIGVPDAILHKPGALTPEERKIIEKHPQAGYEMLLGISHLKEEIIIVLAHQEKWNGTGYPLGLRGEEIPLGARLFAIADTFDALTSDRPYRKGRSYAVARQIIAEEAGRQFDPQAVEVFLAVPPEEWERIRAQVTTDITSRRAHQAERRRRGVTGCLPTISLTPPAPPAE